MQTSTIRSDSTTLSSSYARARDNARRVQWDLDRDVLRDRKFDFSGYFLPDGLTRVSALDFLSDPEARRLSQIQGRTYANLFGLVERFINTKVLELSREHGLGDQVALEALVQFSQEELKHQELFRRLEQLMAEGMPAGYTLVADPDQVAKVVLGKSTWSVLALTTHIELFTQVHYTESIQPSAAVSPLFKDVFLFHWKEESQHAVLDELEWRRADAQLSPEARDQAVDDFIALVGAVDGILQAQAASDVAYFRATVGRAVSEREGHQLERGVLAAYRWQYIFSGAQHPRFQKVLGSMVTPAQAQRVASALASMAS
jgi:hypothetical protein